MIVIISAIVWILICVYTDWKMYYTNQKYISKHGNGIDTEFEYKLSFCEGYVKGLFFIFYPILLFLFIFWNGTKIFSRNRSIFTGEIIK